MTKITNGVGKKPNTIYINLDNSLEETNWLHNIRNEQEKEYIEKELVGKKKVSYFKAKEIGNSLGLNWDIIDIKEFIQGMNEELEHVDVTKGDLVITAKIVLVHLKENSQYYTKLASVMKKEWR